MSLKDKIDLNKVPVHVAIIMDGNGRWAKARAKNRLSGHQQGAKSLQNVLEACGEIGVKYFTVYAFSTENWNRPQDEVNGLMELLVNSINNELNKVVDKGIKINVIGQKEKLPDHVRKALDKAIETSKDNDKFIFNIALSYSGRWEIINAVNHIIQESKNTNHDFRINEESFKNYLTTKDIPDPDLLIRTSGELRISNFLLYQIAYTELYFTEKLWPDFGKEDFFAAILDYQKRERRFGKTSEQIYNRQ